jgi:hypothetical protein
MKPNRTKCTWAACIAAMAVCMTLSTAHVEGGGANLGNAYISNVVSVPAGQYCAVVTRDGNSNDYKWDIQAGGTYDVTLSGVTDCANGGADSSIQVIVMSSVGGNIGQSPILTATQVDTGVYTFRITLAGQCLTMPIRYCTSNGSPSTGIFAQDYDGTGAGGKQGHLRTATFDNSNGPCTVTGEDTSCQGGPTPTPPPTGSITACKFYDKNANGVQDAGEPGLIGWPFCISPLDNANPPQQTQFTAGGCVTWSNLTVPGDYTVTEANANETNWFHSPDPMPPPLIVNGTSTIIFPPAGGTQTIAFGNYCTQPSGGLTLGFWSNKNGNKVLTGNTSGVGTTLLTAVTNLLNSPCTGGGRFVNANGQIHNFTGTYADFKNWLLGANATNMAYMLSAQMATLLLDTHYGATIGAPPVVDGNAFDLCSHMTINGLLAAACDSITGAGNQYTLSGNPSRPGQEMLKNCIDKINNNGDVVPATPCSYTFPTPPAPCP